MKKRVSALLCLLLLTGCTNYNVNVSKTADQSAAQSAGGSALSAQGDPAGSAAASVDQTGVAQAAQGEQSAYAVTTAAECFGEAFQFVAEEAGSYRFTASEGAADLGWDVYVLDAAFDDDPRYLMQVYDPALTLKGEDEGELIVKSDQAVYCFCSVNSDTADQAAEQGTLSVYFTPASELDAQAQLRASSDVIDVDAADFWDDGGYFFEAEQDAGYTVSRDGAEDWEVYVLDEEFEDALRYLPQANEPVVTNEGSFQVKQGQFVYCLTSLNAFTTDEAPEYGVSVLHLAPQ